MLSHERLTKLIRYEPETGRFFNRTSRSSRAMVNQEINPRNRHVYIDGIFYTLSSLAWHYVYGYLPLGRLGFRDGNKYNLKIYNITSQRRRVSYDLRKDIEGYCARCPDKCDSLCPFYKYK